MRLTSLLWCALALSLGGCDDFFGSSDPDAGPVNGGVGDPCSAEAHCRAGLACADMRCAPAGLGLEGSVCTLTGDCMDGLYCGARRTCVPAGSGVDGADCGSTADCGAGLLCVVEGLGFRCRASGEGDIGDECTDDRACLAGLRCVAGPGGSRTCLNPAVIEGDAGVSGPPPTLPFWPGETCEVDDGPPTAYFRVPRGDETDRDFYRLPFPNDVRRTATGLDLSGHPAPASALSIDVVGRHIAAAEDDLDGFATNPVIYFRFSRPYDWGSATVERIWLVDLTPGSPDYGANVGRGVLTTAGSITRYICPNWLAIRRSDGGPLRPGTTYGALIIDGLRTNEEDGFQDIGRDADLDVLLSAVRPSDEPLASAWDKYAVLRDWLAREDTPDVPSILNAAVFTTQRATNIVPALRDVVRRGSAPTLRDVTVCDAGVASPCDDGAQRRCSAANDDYWEVHARIALPQFQLGTPPFEEPEDGGGMSLDSGGLPVVQRREDVCMVMTIPKGSAPPAEGFPIAIYAHGTGGAFTAPVANGLASTFATGDGGSGAPRAVTVSIDLPLHGSRRGDSTREPDVLVFNFANPRAARDNFLQGAADLMSVIRWAEESSIAAAELPTDFDVRFDPSRIVMFAHSQGATHAQLLAPYEPSLAAVVLSGAGGNLTRSLLTKTEPVNIAGALPLALLDVDGSGGLVGGDHHPALALFQMFYERVDPVNYGRLYRREPARDAPAHVFMTYGRGDRYSTEPTMAAFAQSAGFPHLSPVLAEIGLGDPVSPPLSGNLANVDVQYTFGLRQYDPNAGEDGHFVATGTERGRADTTRFLLEALAGAIPPIGE